MKILENVSLKDHNTFGVAVNARYFTEVQSTEELQAVLLQWQGERPFILGGGSNILLTGEVGQLVIRNNIRGRAATPINGNKARVSAGEARTGTSSCFGA